MKLIDKLKINHITFPLLAINKLDSINELELHRKLIVRFRTFINDSK